MRTEHTTSRPGLCGRSTTTMQCWISSEARSRRATQRPIAAAIPGLDGMPRNVISVGGCIDTQELHRVRYADEFVVERATFRHIDCVPSS